MAFRAELDRYDCQKTDGRTSTLLRERFYDSDSKTFQRSLRRRVGCIGHGLSPTRFQQEIRLSIGLCARRVDKIRGKGPCGRQIVRLRQLFSAGSDWRYGGSVLQRRIKNRSTARYWRTASPLV
jgi:hypothetical protein